MSRQPIALSTDLLRLQNEGYDLEIRAGHLMVKDVPYVDGGCAVKRGTLVMPLDLNANVTQKPSTHITYWIGDHPCHHNGGRIEQIANASIGPFNLAEELVAHFIFSAKADYTDFHHKVTTYVGRIAGEAAVLDDQATACTYPAIPADEEEGVFRYVDTASSRAGIAILNDRTKGLKIGIVGLGGTGSYILDYIAKTEVAEIHLFDGDVFLQHNAFRGPGAPSLEELAGHPQKVTYWADQYAKMRRGIIVHPEFLEGDTLKAVDGLDFIFLCLDQGPAKRAIVERLIANHTPFVETGMGVVLNDGQLAGIVRTTSCTRATVDKAKSHISYAADDGLNEYATNIQIVELNALNAAIAVINWKKSLGIYIDTGQYYSGFSIPTGEIASETIHDAA